MSKNRVSVRDVARASGVSASTASRALKHNPSISQETTRRVLAVAQQMGYKDSKAEAGKTSFVGILHPNAGINILSEIERSLESELAGMGYDSVCLSYRAGNVPSGASAVRRQTQLLARLGAEAVVVFAESIRDAAFPNPGIPMIVFNLEEVAVKDAPYPNISFDYPIGARLAAEELLRQGCTKPVVLYNSHYTFGKGGRYDEFLACFGEAGHVVPSSRLVYSDRSQSSYDEAHDAIRYLVAKKTSFDSVYAGSDWRAFGALSALRELGVTVPDEVRVIGFDGSDIAQHNPQPITSVVCNARSAASKLSKALSAALGGEPRDGEDAVVPVYLFRGQTT